jgi:hypothetical protein
MEQQHWHMLSKRSYISKYWHPTFSKSGTTSQLERIQLSKFSGLKFGKKIKDESILPPLYEELF